MRLIMISIGESNKTLLSRIIDFIKNHMSIMIITLGFVSLCAIVYYLSLLPILYVGLLLIYISWFFIDDFRSEFWVTIFVLSIMITSVCMIVNIADPTPIGIEKIRPEYISRTPKDIRIIYGKYDNISSDIVIYNSPDSLIYMCKNMFANKIMRLSDKYNICVDSKQGRK